MLQGKIPNPSLILMLTITLELLSPKVTLFSQSALNPAFYTDLKRHFPRYRFKKIVSEFLFQIFQKQDNYADIDTLIDERNRNYLNLPHLTLLSPSYLCPLACV